MARGYDISALGDPARVTEAVNADIAASTQKLFEETYLKAVRSLDRMLSGGGIRTDNLCLSGGTALNCPSNSRIWREGPFDNVFIEPTCDDGGLAIGAALHIYHNLLEQPRRIETTSPSPYLGITYGESAVEAALETASGIVWSQPDDPAAAAAADLVGDKIIAWFEGGSEAGPRALGHRSILADVRNAITRMRMQRLEHLFGSLPRLVRDLSTELGKQVMVDFEGGEVELDREMVEMVRDPLTHIIRNAIDHGLEGPGERIKGNKREIGLLKFAARQSGNQITLTITDDGRGINTERLAARNKAWDEGRWVREGLLAHAEKKRSRQMAAE